MGQVLLNIGGKVNVLVAVLVALISFSFVQCLSKNTCKCDQVMLPVWEVKGINNLWCFGNTSPISFQLKYLTHLKDLLRYLGIVRDVKTDVDTKEYFRISVAFYWRLLLILDQRLLSTLFGKVRLYYLLCFLPDCAPFFLLEHRQSSIGRQLQLL